jgi:hypothetical protein
MPTVIRCYLLALVGRSTLRFAQFPWQDALTLRDTAGGLGASLALLGDAGAVLFLLPPGLRAQEGAA